MIYGAYGFVGKEVSRLAKEKGLNLILAGRDKEKTQRLASKLHLDYAVFSLDDTKTLEFYAKEVNIILNCAGPFIETYRPIVQACIKFNTHYLDISGEIPVFQAIHDLDYEAKNQTSMLLPGIGFDVAPTDCIGLFLKENFKTGDKLTLAFRSEGPAGLPPGTIKTMVSLIPYGNWIRKNGALVRPKKGIETKSIKYYNESINSLRIAWGDIFTAFYSTGIPNIEVYASFPKLIMMQMKFIEYFRPILSKPPIMKFMQKTLKGGSTNEERKNTVMWVYGELSDPQGNKAICRMKGPEGGLLWTSISAVYALLNIEAGNYKVGYQTPASAFGSDFVSKMEGVDMEEIEYVWVENISPKY